MDQNISRKAAYGSFLIIPLKYDPDSLDLKRIEQIGTGLSMTTMDLNENVKAMLTPSDPASIGSGWMIRSGELSASLCSQAAGTPCTGFQVADDTGCFDFELNDSWLYVFHTRTAFLCLSLSFRQMETLETICNPGWAYNPASFFWIDGTGSRHPFSIDQWLSGFLNPLGLHKFFDGASSFLLEAYAYIFAVLPEWFQTLEEMKKIVFNLHKMLPIDAPGEDEAEEDIRYAYAARNVDAGAYRWGCCITSQTISYIIADENMDFAAQRDAQADDGLPVVLLALYEKYTCLRFTEFITRMKKNQIRELKDLMLTFQAFGTVTPANLSRWHNVKQIYANLLEVNDVPAAIQDITSKLNILTAHQEAVEHARSETIINLITLFGIVSILASVLSIVQILADGDLLIWVSTILTTVMLALITALAVLRR